VFDFSNEIQEVGDFKPLGPESKEVLLYYGNGGPSPDPYGERATFFDLEDYYEAMGFPTAYTNNWPSDVNDYRVIFIIMPGNANDNGIYFFSTTQVNELKDFMMNGGRLVVMGEHSGAFGINTVNKLLSDLGVGIQQRADNRLYYIDPYATDITSDQLTEGVTEFDMNGAGVSTLILSGSAISLVRDRTMYDLVAVDQIAGAPSRPGSDVIVFGDTQVLDDYQLGGREPYDASYHDNLVFADNIMMWVTNLPPVAVLSPPAQTINEGQTAYFSGYGSYDPDPMVDMIFVVDTSPSMPDEWTILSTTLPQIESDLLAGGYDLEFVVYGLDHGTETQAKFPVMDDWLDYGARLDPSGDVVQDCVRNKEISNPFNYNVKTANPSPGLIDPTKRCDYYSPHMSEGWAQGAAYVALNYPWREGATRIVVPIGDSAPWTQLGDGSPANSRWGRPFTVYTDWIIVNETSDILNANDVVAFPMYDGSLDPDGGGPLEGIQQQIFLTMAERTGGEAFVIDYSQEFSDNVKLLISSAILDYSWDFDAGVDVDLDGNYINDDEASGMNVSHAYFDDCSCTVTLTVADVGGASAQAQVGVTVLNVAPSAQWISSDVDNPGLTPPYPEGDEILFQAIYYDPGLYDTHTFDWDFGDGTFLVGGSQSETHAYGDNSTYTVVLTVTDDDGGVGVDDTPPLETHNVDPKITSFVYPSITVFEGTTPYDLEVEFSDPGWLDTHTGLIDWGDGTLDSAALTEENNPPDATGSFGASRIFGDDGVFTVFASVVDDDGGSDTAGTNVSVVNLPPEVAVRGSNVINEGGTVTLSARVTDAGSDDITITWDWGDGTSETREYFNDGVGPDPPNSPLGNWPFGLVDAGSHAYGDNGNFPVTITVTDDDGASTTITEVVIVLNVDPEIQSIDAYVNATIIFRIAGEKWHDVVFHLFEDDIEIASAHLVRYPGSPNDQAVTLADISLSFSSRFSFVAYYTPEDDPVNGQPNGANPGWVIMRFEDGTESRLHHTFNVMHPETWVWQEDDLSPYLVGHNVKFMATASDVGSDDLTFQWDWGDSTTSSTTYFNNGVSPDPASSPEINPITVTDFATHAYATVGPFTITLTVFDDDGGSATMTYVF
jgi:PKD repeat protein